MKNKSTEQINTRTFDIVIAGGGLSGALMAQSVARLKNAQGKPLSIAVIEATPVNTDIALTFDDRVLALAHGSAAYLDDVQTWDELKQVATPILDIHISDRGHYGKARINAKEHGVNALGYVIEMSLIGKSIIKAVMAQPNVAWFCPDSIDDILWQQSHVTLSLTSGQQLIASLLIGCDGGHSTCRQQANISSQYHEYGQSAVIANVRTQKAHNNLAFERFTESGPIAVLPLSNDRCSLVWTLTPEQAKQVETLSDQDFAVALTEAFGQWLGPIVEVGQRSSYPLVLVQADEQVFHRLALVGNASHTIHPIAGQGFNLGVRDVKVLTALIEDAVVAGKDIGEFSMLNQYALHRAKDQKQVITLTDSLVTLFSNEYTPLVAGRNVGLKAMNYLSPLQQLFVEKTMGYR